MNVVRYMPSLRAVLVISLANSASLGLRASANTVAQSLADLTISASTAVLTSMYEPAGIPSFDGERDAAVEDTFNLSENFSFPVSSALNVI